MTPYHIPVLVAEVLEILKPNSGALFIDATLGGGGHTKALLDRGSEVIGIDQDPEALEYVRQRTDLNHANLTLVEDNFEHVSDSVKAHSAKPVTGILFDLGVSSHQFDTPERGFSFQSSAPLDMRMSPSQAVTARDLINGLGKHELYDLFTKYGDEQLARPISEAIIRARMRKPIDTTSNLAQLIEKVYHGRRSHLHPATKVFQALRMAVNDEMNVLKNALPAAVNLLAPGGRMAVISFHEGEDRIVKHFMKDLPADTYQELTDKPITPTPEEIAQNPRSRSAKLRGVEKIQL
ncbi:16S rRNA (cytosine(1402)-N(4))-methyltransferase [Microgenomates group bacterium RIFCSPLOWO2_01_FULL_47_10]|nr:MAG: 16S rRNA (cytosine(1402)-N(4))-methyltransferase [Microgenomates group bacterium RIFCSPLOWO2_01_FULL_47_10]